ncbi:MAG: bacteriohemerythrin [Methylococcaceae bacterium]|nr:bacteriohemerythrin [Methylococcaceae bacterium]
MTASLKLSWSDALSTGNRALDVQHKYLIDIINELAELIESGQSVQKIKTILNLLQYYTEWHFHREELCMDRFQCPVADLNKTAHQQFIETFLGFRREYAASGGDQDLALRMYKQLTDWLVNHIQRVDGQISPCMIAETANSG